MAEKITIDTANRLSREGFVERFGPLYEHSPWVAEEAYLQRPFDGIDGLHDAMVKAGECHHTAAWPQDGVDLSTWRGRPLLLAS